MVLRSQGLSAGFEHGIQFLSDSLLRGSQVNGVLRGQMTVRALELSELLLLLAAIAFPVLDLALVGRVKSLSLLSQGSLVLLNSQFVGCMSRLELGSELFKLTLKSNSGCLLG